MQHIHFIAIGGAAMHSLAIALSENQAYKITGSDDEIFEPSYSRLQSYNLLPDKMGWFPERINENTDTVILGMHAREDNPELIRAKELGIQIVSFPEFLYNKTIGKIRVVIGGSHGKTTTTAMILHVMNKLNIKTDYLVGAQINGLKNMVKLSFDARIFIFEGDEYLTSALDKRPKFHLYFPHIAVITGIAWDHVNVFPTFKDYVKQFQTFAGFIEPQGRLIYFSGDKELRRIAEKARRDIACLPYTTPKYKIKENTLFLETRKKTFPLKIFGVHNLQNLEAARIVCKQLGILEDNFYSAIADFDGAENRLQKIYKTKDSIAYKDFAHSPSKLSATVKAVKEQYPEKKLIACMELHTFSSLTKEFLPQYAGCMLDADFAFIYYNPEVLLRKKLSPISPSEIKKAFGGDNLVVFSNSKDLQDKLKRMDTNNTALLFMTSGNFSGTDITKLSKELLEK